jgi:sodium transport system permease protein
MGGRSKTALIFGKEARVLLRDRRLVFGVVLGSLVVFPVLMGLLGRIARPGGDGSPVQVVLYNADDVLKDVASQLEGVEVWDRGPLTEEARGGERVSAGRGAGRYWIRADAGEGAAAGVAGALERRLLRHREDVVRTSLEARGVDPGVLEPFRVERLDASDPGHGSTGALAILIPYLAIILLVSNAVRATYIAVGEKEYNTLASLLVTSVPRRSIVLGKSLAVMALSVTASVLLVLGMVIITKLGFSPVGLESDGTFSLGWVQSWQILVNLVTLALLISGLIMVIGTYARTQREAGFFTAPLLFVSIFLAIFSFSPGDFPLGAYAVPILGNALSMRAAILGDGRWMEVGLAGGMNLACFFLTMRIAAGMYERETVLFRP